MNCAPCCPHVPPPASVKGVASGRKNTPERLAPDPPLIWNLLLEYSSQNASPVKGPSVGADQDGGLPLSWKYPLRTKMAVWLAVRVPPVIFQAPLRPQTIAALELDVAVHGVVTAGVSQLLGSALVGLAVLNRN